MMHKFSTYTLLALASLLMALSCGKEAGLPTEGDEAVAVQNAGITGEVAAFEVDSSLQGVLPQGEADGQTRTTLVYAEGKGLNFFWSEDDNVAVFGSEGRNQQIPLFISDVAGQQVKKASFQISKDYGLKAGVQYIAYCPIIDESIYLSAAEVPFDYTGQVQKDGEVTSTEHLGSFDYMVSESTVPTADNVALFNFKHKCCPVLVQMSNVPAGTYKSVSLVADDEVFALKGTMDLFEGTSAVSESSSTVSVSFKKSVTLASAGSLNAWIMLFPVNLTGKKVQVVLTPSSGSEIRCDVDASALKDYVAGKAYRIAVNAAKVLPAGALPGKFTVDAQGTKVCFAKGNLQYQPSTDSWHLADNQYDFVGGTGDDTVVYGNVSGSDNTLAAIGGYNGWRDLHTWDTEYFNKVDSGWMVLSQAQMSYILSTRSTSTGAHYFLGNLCLSDKDITVFGLFLFPDDWAGTFFPVSPAIGTSHNKYDNNNNSWCKGITTIVTMTSAEFASMQENDGVVFLPETGRLNGSTLEAFKGTSYCGDVQSAGHLTLRYWTSTAGSSTSRAYALMSYDGSHLGVYDYNINSANFCTEKTYGLSIRCATYTN